MSTLKVNTLTDTAATKSVPIEDVVNGTARAWVNFDGTFGTSPFTVANGGIRAAYNVTSVTDNGTGDYTVTFTNAMPDANYAFTLGVMGDSTSNDNWLNVDSAVSPTPSALRIRNRDAASSQNSANVCVAIFR